MKKKKGGVDKGEPSWKIAPKHRMRIRRGVGRGPCVYIDTHAPSQAATADDEVSLVAVALPARAAQRWLRGSAAKRNPRHRLRCLLPCPPRL